MPVETTTQQKLVLQSLQKRPHNTIELRKLDILCPNPRIMELRKMGFYIVTMWEYVKDSQDDTHKIGRYIYIPGRDNLTSKGEEFKAELFCG